MPEHRVARCVSVAIVDHLESVDVREGQHEPSVRPSRPVDLVGERELAHLPTIRAGQRVEVRRMQLRLEAGTLGGGDGAIVRRTLAVGRGTDTIGGGDR